MASTGSMNGSALLLKITATTIAKLTSKSYNVSRASIDVSNQDSSGWAEFLYGQGSASFDCEGIFDESVNGYDELHAAVMAKTLLTLLWTSGVTGDKTYTGSCIVESLSLTAPSEDKVTFSCTLKLTGPPVVGTVS